MNLSAKQEVTLRTIRRCAARLAAECGYDGFTMDDLAESANVSRRTVFNYVAGKEDAVFGPPPQFPPAQRLDFRAGEPNGNLLDDLAALVLSALPEFERSDAEVTRQLFLRNPELIVRLLERLDQPLTELQEDIAVRLQRPQDDPEVVLAVRLLLVVTHHAIEAFNADLTDRDFPGFLRDSVVAVRALTR